MTSPSLTAHDLRTDGLPSPLGIGTRTPRFSWTVHAVDPTEDYVGVRIQVGRVPLHPDNVGPADLWDSGDVMSASTWVDYAGEPLASRDAFWWRIRPIGADGPGSWTEPGYAEVGLLDRADWSAAWITHPDWTQPEPPEPCPVLSTTFAARATSPSVTRSGRSMSPTSSPSDGTPHRAAG